MSVTRLYQAQHCGQHCAFAEEMQLLDRGQVTSACACVKVTPAVTQSCCPLPSRQSEMKFKVVSNTCCVCFGPQHGFKRTRAEYAAAIKPHLAATTLHAYASTAHTSRAAAA
jgi:hypothetical protein